MAYDIRFLLNLGADVNAQDEDGLNCLFYAIELREENRIQLFRTLIEAGADPHVRDNNGYTVLHWAIINVDYDIELLNFLIEEIGIDPLVKSNDNTSVLATAIQMYFEAFRAFFYPYKTTAEIKTRYNVIRYLFDLPQIQNGSSDPSSQIALLSNLHYAKEISDFDFFFTNQFMSGCDLIERRERLEYSSQYYNLGPVGIFLNNVFCGICLYKTYQFLEKISSLGFSIIDPPNCLSPLAILIENLHIPESENASFKFVTTLESAKDHDEIDKNETLQLVKKFVESGVYVGQRMIPINEFDPFDNYNEELIQLAEEILIPDVFFVLTVISPIRYGSNGPLPILRYLLPHLGSPPLALALFVQQDSYYSISPQVFLPILFEFGPVPPGTRLLAELRQYFLTLAEESSNEPFCQAFEEMHSSPPTLMQLCRSQIRMSVAAQMPTDRRGPHLPDLISTLTKIPPPLRKYLQMWPEEPLNVVVCDNQQIADRANEILLKYFELSSI